MTSKSTITPEEYVFFTDVRIVMNDILDYIHCVNKGIPVPSVLEEKVSCFDWNADQYDSGEWKIYYPTLKRPSKDAKKIVDILSGFHPESFGKGFG